MDKVAVGLIADILYIKGIICYEEFDAIQNIENPEEIHSIIERMLTDDFNVYKRGEAYVGYAK